MRGGKFSFQKSIRSLTDLYQKSNMPKASAVKKATKKTTKKVAKKTTKKVTSSVAKKAALNGTFKALVCAPDEKCFWTTNGEVLRDLEQLRIAFGSMDDEVFLHHVNKEKNDFADWVESVLEDVACAADLRRAKKPNTAKTVIIKHLKTYQ